MIVAIRAVRLGLVEQCAPLLSDAVICGHDQAFVAALAWPNLAACRKLAPELANADAETMVRHPAVVSVFDRELEGAEGQRQLPCRAAYAVMPAATSRM